MQQFMEETWKKLHSIPEVGVETPKTCAYLKEQLLSFGYQVRQAAGGLVGVLDSGKPGPKFALRADTDALEFAVDGEIKNYHGCCHDCHSTMVLAAAKTMAEEGIQRGTLYIVFQPGEEPGNGSDLMLSSGELDDIEEMLGLHFTPNSECPHGKVSPAVLHKGLVNLHATIRGKNSHGSVPEKGINAVEAGVLAVNAVNCIRMSPDKEWSVKITRFSADKSSDNTIPDYARLTFDLRAENNELLTGLLDKAKAAIEMAVQAVGASCEMEAIMNPAPSYSEEMVDFVSKLIKDELGEEAYCPPVKAAGSEDFHVYSFRRNIKTAYMDIGANVDPGIHIYENTFDHEMLNTGYRLLCEAVRRKLGQA